MYNDWGTVAREVHASLDSLRQQEEAAKATMVGITVCCILNSSFELVFIRQVVAEALRILHQFKKWLMRCLSSTGRSARLLNM